VSFRQLDVSSTKKIVSNEGEGATLGERSELRLDKVTGARLGYLLVNLRFKVRLG